jgi:hypothetical protein
LFFRCCTSSESALYHTASSGAEPVIKGGDNRLGNPPEPLLWSACYLEKRQAILRKFDNKRFCDARDVARWLAPAAVSASPDSGRLPGCC